MTKYSEEFKKLLNESGALILDSNLSNGMNALKYYCCSYINSEIEKNSDSVDYDEMKEALDEYQHKIYGSRTISVCYFDEYIKYLVKQNGFINVSDNTPLGNTTMGNYYRSLQTCCKGKSVLKQNFTMIYIKLIDYIKSYILIKLSNTKTQYFMGLLDIYGIEALEMKEFKSYYDYEHPVLYREEKCSLDHVRKENFTKLDKKVKEVRIQNDIDENDVVTEMYIDYLYQNNGWIKELDQTRLDYGSTHSTYGRYMIVEKIFVDKYSNLSPEEKENPNRIKPEVVEHRIKNYYRILDVMQELASEKSLAQSQSFERVQSNRIYSTPDHFHENFDALIKLLHEKNGRISEASQIMLVTVKAGPFLHNIRQLYRTSNNPLFKSAYHFYEEESIKARTEYSKWVTEQYIEYLIQCGGTIKYGDQSKIGKYRAYTYLYCLKNRIKTIQEKEELNELDKAELDNYEKILHIMNNQRNK